MLSSIYTINLNYNTVLLISNPFDVTFLVLITFFLPLVSIIYLIISDNQFNTSNKSDRFFAINSTIINTIFLISIYQKENFSTTWSFFHLTFSDFNLNFSLDYLSFLLIFLTTYLTLLCLLISTQITNSKNFSILFLLIQFLLFLAWTVRDIFIFYICFESVLIPMFLVINIWGSRNRKYKASYMFFLYTLIGSIFMLVAIFYIFVTKGTTNLDILLIQPFSFCEQVYLWVAIFIAMAVKIPIFPFHSWLPEAHVEAPTSGSVLLAGVLLKLGGYGIIRFILPLFPDASTYFSTFITAICLSSIIYSSFCALRQNDLKRIIAYASIAHMNLIVLGLFSCNLYGIQGSIFQMISHGLVSGLLFICIGMLYDRSKTRLVASYSGLVNSMPLFVVVFFIASIANMAFPFTCSFIGEFSVFFGIFISNAFVGMLSTSGMFLCGTYSIWLLNRISFGNSLNINLINKDLTEHEVIISLLLIIPIIFLGLQPNYILAGFATVSSGGGLLIAL